MYLWSIYKYLSAQKLRKNLIRKFQRFGAAKTTTFLIGGFANVLVTFWREIFFTSEVYNLKKSFASSHL